MQYPKRADVDGARIMVAEWPIKEIRVIKVRDPHDPIYSKHKVFLNGQMEEFPVLFNSVKLSFNTVTVFEFVGHLFTGNAKLVFKPYTLNNGVINADIAEVKE